MSDTWREVETITKTGETDQGVKQPSYKPPLYIVNSIISFTTIIISIIQKCVDTVLNLK